MIEASILFCAMALPSPQFKMHRQRGSVLFTTRQFVEEYRALKQILSLQNPKYEYWVITNVHLVPKGWERFPGNWKWKGHTIYRRKLLENA